MSETHYFHKDEGRCVLAEVPVRERRLYLPVPKVDEEEVPKVDEEEKEEMPKDVEVDGGNDE